MDQQQQRSQPQPSAPPAEPQRISTPAPENHATCNGIAPSQVTTTSSTASFVSSYDRSTTSTGSSGHVGGSRFGGANVQVLTRLQEQFLALHARTKKVLVRNTTNLSRFKFKLTSLPLCKGCQHFLQEEQNSIMNATDADKICSILEPYCNYIDYAFLRHLIKEFGTNELQKDVESYIAELEHFEKKTSVKDFNSAIQDNRVLPAHFRTVTITQAKDPAEYSMHDVRQLRNEVVNRSTLHEYAVFLQAVRCNSVEIVLAYPPEAHTELLAVFNEEFMETHNIAFSCSATPKRCRLKRRNSVAGIPGTPPQHFPADKSMCKAR